MKKGIRNANAVAGKLGLALIRATNSKLEVTREESQKREKIMGKRKTKTMTVKCHRAKGAISLSSEEEENYESDTRDETDPNHVGNDKYLLQL